MWSKTAWKCKVIIILSRSTRGNVFQKLLQQITAIVSPPSQALHHNYDGKRSLIVFIIPCFRIILFMHDHAMHMSFNGPCVSTCVWVYELSSLNGWPWDVGIQVGALKCCSKPSTHPTWWSTHSWYTRKEGNFCSIRNNNHKRISGAVLFPKYPVTIDNLASIVFPLPCKNGNHGVYKEPASHDYYSPNFDSSISTILQVYRWYWGLPRSAPHILCLEEVEPINRKSLDTNPLL